MHTMEIEKCFFVSFDSFPLAALTISLFVLLFFSFDNQSRMRCDFFPS